MSEPRRGLARPPTATRLGRRAGRASPGSASPGSPPPTPCCTSARGSPRSTTRADGERRREQAELLEILGADVRLGAGRDRDAARRRRPASSPRRAGGPTRPLLAAGRGARHPGLGRGRAGLAAARPRATPAPWLVRHRHQRQDHDRQMLDVDAAAPPGCAPSRPATSGTPLRRGGAGPRAVRRARRRAVQLPAALARTRCAPQAAAVPQRRRRTTSTGTARSTPTPRTRAAIYERHRRSPASTTSPTRRPSGWCADADVRRGLPGDRLHPRHARPSGCSASSTTCSSTAPSSRSGRRSAAELGTVADVAPVRAAQRRQRPRRGRAGPRVRRPAGRGPRRAARVPARRRTASPTVGDVDGVHLRRRLQGHQPARRRGVAARLRLASSGSPAGWPRAPTFDDLVARRAPTGCAAWCCSARDRARDRATRWRDTRPMSPSSRSRRRDRTTGVMDERRRAPPPRWPGPATRCCWRPAAPRWTCSPTTPHAATRSPPPSARSAGQRPTDAGGRRGEHDRRRAAATGRAGARHRGWLGSPCARRALDRPLTVVLPAARRHGAAARPRPGHGAVGLERRRRYEHDGDSLRGRPAARLMFAVHRPAAGVASPSRLPRAAGPRLAWPGCSSSRRPARRWCSSRLGVEVNGNRNWLGLGGRSASSRPSSPSSRWCCGPRDVYAASEQLLDAAGSTLLVPVVPGRRRRDRRLVLARPRPRHRAGAGRDPARRCSGSSARPARLFALARRGRRSSRSRCLVATSADRLDAPHRLRSTRSRDYLGAGWQAGARRSSRSSQRRLVGRRARRQPARSGAACPRRTPTSSSPSSARSSAWSARSLVLAPVRRARLRRLRRRAAHRRPVRPLRGRRRHGLDRSARR